MHKPLIFILFLLTTSFTMSIEAAIYKQVDANGHVTYSNLKIKGGKQMDIEPADANFGTKAQNELKSKSQTKSSGPANFPNVDSNTQRQRDQSRKNILLSELAAERVALQEAKTAYAAGEASPEADQRKNANGANNTFRNVNKSQEKMKALQLNIDVHLRNVKLLETEISNIN